MNEKLNAAWTWVRGHLVIVISALLILASMGLLFGWINGAMADFKQGLAARSGDLRTIEQHINRTVSNVPSDDPDQPTRSLELTINPASVDALKQIFQRMNGGFAQLFETVTAFNRVGLDGRNAHEPLVDNLFPGPASNNARFNARQAYQRALRAIYANVLNAGTPPTPESIELRLATVQQKYLTSRLGASESDPQLVRQKVDTRLSLLADRARDIRVYGQPPVFGGEAATGGLFDVAPWATGGDRPSMTQLWHGQVELWVQQDLAMAIALANRPNPGSAATPSVLNLPVKRILSMVVEDNYFDPPDTPSPARRGSADDPATVNYQPPDLNEPIVSYYDLSPTGRVSNDLYDVRHARLSVIIDSTRIPRLLNAIAQVNLMTPVIESISTVDQTDALAAGYLYGDGVDVVQLDLRVETLWLRPWTAGHFSRETAEQLGEPFNPGLMPDEVRVRRNLPPRDDDFDAAAATGDRSGSAGERGRYSN